MSRSLESRTARKQQHPRTRTAPRATCYNAHKASSAESRCQQCNEPTASSSHWCSVVAYLYITPYTHPVYAERNTKESGGQINQPRIEAVFHYWPRPCNPCVLNQALVFFFFSLFRNLEGRWPLQEFLLKIKTAIQVENTKRERLRIQTRRKQLKKTRAKQAIYTRFGSIVERPFLPHPYSFRKKMSFIEEKCFVVLNDGGNARP